MIGKISDALVENGLWENTLFVFTTDHGIAFPRAKCTLYDPGVKTNLIMSLPSTEILNGNREIDCMVSNIDLLPTLLDIIDGKKAKNIEGKSFLPILKGEKEFIRTEIFTEKSWHDIYDPMRAIRTERYKFIKYFKEIETQYMLPEDISKMTQIGKFIKRKMKDKFKQPRAREELFDLENDSNELNNLINDPDYKIIADDLRRRLNEWMVRTNDPLLKGDIPHPLKKGNK